MTSQSPDTLPLYPDYLDANRAGKLADAQRAALRRFDRGPVGNNLLVAAACVVVAVVLVVNHSPARYASLRPFAAVAALAAAVWLVLRSLGLGGRLVRDLRAGRVESIEGAITKGHVVNVGPDDTNVFYLDVAGKHFWVYHHTYRAAPDAGIVRLFYLPHSHDVVNLERLADRPLPAGAGASPLGVIESIAPALRSHDRLARANAAATLAALHNAIGAEQVRAATPPPLSQRDPRPLAEAIIGRWNGGALALVFNPDGTMTGTLPDGGARRGRWSVDSAGRLHANGIDGDQSGDAWIVGDTLTLVSDGAVMTLRRA